MVIFISRRRYAGYRCLGGDIRAMGSKAIEFDFLWVQFFFHFSVLHFIRRWQRLAHSRDRRRHAGISRWLAADACPCVYHQDSYGDRSAAVLSPGSLGTSIGFAPDSA